MALKFLSYRSFSLLILAICAVFGAPRAEAATETIACFIIHRYESYCGNLEPNACAQYRQDFDYWGNAEHRKAWDDFFGLCGQVGTRHSQACLAYLGIESTCASTVEVPPEEVKIYQPDSDSFNLNLPREPETAFNNGPNLDPAQLCVSGQPCSPALNPETETETGSTDPQIPIPQLQASPKANPAIGPTDPVIDTTGNRNGAEIISDPSASVISGSGCSLQPQSSSRLDFAVHWLMGLLLLPLIRRFVPEATKLFFLR